MDIFSILTLIGGLAMFLFGMNTMGDGLVMLSGGKLEKILEKLTSKRIMALLLGAFVTAVIQSSSATTVMVVGFVNSGIMKLTQAVGIIMGANIGTTVTSWLLSLAGIESGNVFIRLLKPSSFSPVLAAIGIILIMSSKSGSKKHTVGNILIGFAVLMFGMDTMSGAVSGLRDNPSFTGILTRFSNPIMGMLAGAILTAIIQSSSASVGILQALCISGLINYGAAIPIIMGQNIGTCVTAMISSVGASKNAKRAACIHLYFNLIGTLVFMVGFYSLNSFLHFSFLENLASASGIAVIHSLFNVGCALLLFPFAKGLVKLAELTLPEKDEKEPVSTLPPVLTALDERFLDRPAFAMQLCKEAVDDMASKARTAILLTMTAIEEYDESKVTVVERLEQEIDHYEDAVGSYLLKLAGKDLSKNDSHLLSILLHSIGDYERISDHAVNLAECLKKIRTQNIRISEAAYGELSSLAIPICDIIHLTTEVFHDQDLIRAVDVEPMEQVIDDLVMEMKHRHVTRLRNGECSPEAGLILEDILTHLERVSDHCSNIAAMLIEIQSDSLDMHDYLEGRIKNGDPHFMDEYNRLKTVYVLH